MKRELANSLLSAIMDWDSEDVEKYRERLDDLADWKYDHYQQYRPGSRFIENMSIWLNHFETYQERIVAFDFVLKNLIFISPNEMNHLISMVYPDVIVPYIKKQAKGIVASNKLSISSDEKQMLVKLLINQTLFLGLSDGARTDVFRRASPELSHEQICLSYDIPNEKYEKISQEMNAEVLKMKLEAPLDGIAKNGIIKNIVLLDDFSASGISFIRYDEKEKEWKGKISKLIKSLKDNGYNLSDMRILIILYLSTEHAQKHIIENLKQFDKENNLSVKIHTMQLIKPYIPSSEEERLISKYFDGSVIDSHYAKGKIEKPYLGFDECSLPLVIYHNTPNNTFPILWHGNDSLFPRVTRHKDV